MPGKKILMLTGEFTEEYESAHAAGAGMGGRRVLATPFWHRGNSWDAGAARRQDQSV